VSESNRLIEVLQTSAFPLGKPAARNRADTNTRLHRIPQSFALSGPRFDLYFTAVAAEFKSVSILIPVFNEARTLEEILRRVRAADSSGLAKEIILVDDASTDGTSNILRNLSGDKDLKIFSHPFNRGKGAAIRTAIEHATGDILLIQDADLEYDPSDYPLLLKPILDGRADVVYGSRFTGGTHRVLLFWHYMANRFLTLLSNMLCNLNLTDMETCYKVFRRECVAGMKLTSDRFGIEPELTAKLARRRYRFYETGINYSGRDYSEGKKIGWKDGIAALWFIFRYRFFD
jgi:glycosyltransferase involved in cell wall biosynthesis